MCTWVPPGTIVKYHQGIVEKTEYWSPSYKEEVYTNRKLNKKQSDELQDSLGQILITAIKRQSSNADNLLIPLSGGLDSRYVAALYHQIGQRNVQTYTMGPEESEDQRYASQVAAQLGFQHFKLKIVPEKTWDVAGTFSYIADGMSSINTTLQNFQPFEHFAGKKTNHLSLPNV
jgi:asparagine synthase (glutamine-hydrolysing)